MVGSETAGSCHDKTHPEDGGEICILSFLENADGFCSATLVERLGASFRF